MIESFVDLTYRGLSLGRRIKLDQVRPSSGYLELAAPMPVGAHVTIATDDGVAIDATVTWVYEQIAGAERTPGMIVAPALAAEPAASWWRARVALPDDTAPKLRPARTRPVTSRQRSQTLPTPPPEGAITDEVPTILADLEARVAAAAGIAPPAAGERRTVVINALDQAQLQQRMRSPDPEPALRGTGEHAVIDDGRNTGEHVVIDDGHQTIIMDAIDPTEAGPTEIGPELTNKIETAPNAPDDADTADTGADGADGDDGDGGDGDDDEAAKLGEAPGPGAPGAGGDPAAANRGGRKRRRRR